MANNPKDLQLRELKDTITELNSLIKTLQATLDDMRKSKEESEQKLKNAQEEIDYLRKKLFGTSSEKHVVEIPGQYNLFNEAEQEYDDTLLDDILAEAISETKKRKTKVSNTERFQGVPVKKV